MRTYLSLTVAAFFMLASCQTTAPAPDRPNVILIMTDDQGYGDFGFTGNPVIRTPEIDAMASRSAIMERFYVSPVCAPPRASLMTGRFNYRTRAIDTWIGRAMMEPEEVTVAELLSEAGYATGIFGKWHLGDNYPMRPQDQGFQEVLVHRGGGIGQPADPLGGEGKYTDPILFHNGEETPMKGYCTDIYFDAAMDFIEAGVKQGKPVFAYIPTNAPHGPYHDVPEDLYQMYKQLDLRPAFAASVGDAQAAKLADQTARTFAMITNIDQNVGRLFERLRALGAYDNTLVLFLTDNGPAGPRYVGALRGYKGGVNEGGIRTPLLAHWPARLRAGRASDRVAGHIDMLPTILEACGVPLPAGLQLDGRSILPLLEGKAGEWPDRTVFVQWHRGDVPERFRNFAGVSQRWKILHQNFDEGHPPDPLQFELYDLEADPGEQNNLAATHPDVLARLRQEYDAWFDDVGSTRPDNYAPPRIFIGTPHENPVVLTRQDWRRLGEADNWGPASRGYWLLRAAAAGEYDLRCVFQPEDAPRSLEVKIAAFEQTVSLLAGVTEHTFEGVALPAGDARLDATLIRGATLRGVHQIFVTKR